MLNNKTTGSGQQDPLLSPLEASQMLGYKSKTAHSVLRLIKQGRLPAIRLNARNIKVRLSQVEAFLEASEVGA